MSIRTSLARVADVFAGPTRQQRETDYLNHSKSLVDLERRQREIDRGKFRQF